MISNLLFSLCPLKAARYWLSRRAVSPALSAALRYACAASLSTMFQSASAVALACGPAPAWALVSALSAAFTASSRDILRPAGMLGNGVAAGGMFAAPAPEAVASTVCAGWPPAGPGALGGPLGTERPRLGTPPRGKGVSEGGTLF